MSHSRRLFLCQPFAIPFLCLLCLKPLSLPQQTNYSAQWLCLCMPFYMLWPVLRNMTFSFHSFPFRLAEMENQSCSFFTDSLSPDESLWVHHLPHTLKSVTAAKSLCMDVRMVVHACLHVWCGWAVTLIKKDNENDPWQCARSPSVILSLCD